MEEERVYHTIFLCEDILFLYPREPKVPENIF